MIIDSSKSKVSEVMTKSPKCVESHQPISLALKWMDELRVRHLPVRESGKIVGVISDRDLIFFHDRNELLHGRSVVRVEDAMMSSVLTVSATDTVQHVAAQMIAHRVGSAIVTSRDGEVLGIFTDTDALKLLSDRH